MRKLINPRGFTLIELIVLMVVIVITALIVFVIINPSRRIHAANNATRASHVNLILSAYQNYVAVHKGAHVTSTVAGVTYMIGAGRGAGICAATSTSAKVVLTGLVDKYLPVVPFDPVSGNSNETGYYYYKAPKGRVTIGACDPESEGRNVPVINISR